MIGHGDYIEGCVDVVGSNKGTNNWGWRCANLSVHLKVLLVGPTIFIDVGIYCWFQLADMALLRVLE